MNLEGRIHDTGEHFLGRFEPDEDLPARISARVVADTRRRRQRASFGLGAGVVAVLGGLITLNLARPSGAPPLSAGRAPGGSRTSPSGPTLVSSPATAPAAPAPATTLVQIASTTAAHAAGPDPIADPVVSPTEEVQPELTAGPGAPLLYTSAPVGDSAATIDPLTGTVLGREAAPRAAAPSGPFPVAGYVYSFGDEPIDTCGQRVLRIVADGGEPAPRGLPDSGAQLAVDLAGDVGVLLSSPCTPGGSFAVLVFDPRDPAAVPRRLATVDGAEMPAFVDVSADGSIVVLITSRGATAFDLTEGTTSDPLPSGCVSPVIDAEHGWFARDRIGVSLAECDDVVTVLSGEPGAMNALTRLPECSGSAILALDESMRSDPSNGWFAVADVDHHLAWVVGDSTVFGPWEVGDWIRFAQGT